MRFKPGDWVIVVNVEFSSGLLTLGNRYQVKGYWLNSASLLTLVGIEDEGFYTYRFELANKPLRNLPNWW